MIDPSTVQGAVLWGIVSGITTSAVLALMGIFISRVILPGYLDFVYQGVDLQGVWTFETTMTPSGRFAVQLSLQQHAQKLTGSASITQSGTPASDYVQFFKVNGSTWEGFVMLNLQSSNRKSLSLVTGLFKITGRGEHLEGHWVFRSASKDSAESAELHLVRQAKA